MGRLVKNIFIFTTGKAVYNNEKKAVCIWEALWEVTEKNQR